MPRFDTTDGLTLAYHEWGTQHRGEQPPIVLQHGFIASSIVNWVQPGIADALVGAGRHVIALDARGHGGSSTPHEAAWYGEARMATDVSALYDHLGLDEVHQVGYSMGAIVSLIAATRDRRIARLVVGGVGAGVVELGGVDTRALPDDLLAEALAADDPTTIDHDGARGFRLFADAIGADRLALAAHASMVHASPIALAEIAAPTLVLAGRDDPLAERPRVLADSIPDARTAVLTGDHLGALLDPTFVPAIVDFLAS